jgi:hypothetical protein
VEVAVVQPVEVVVPVPEVPIVPDEPTAPDEDAAVGWQKASTQPSPAQHEADSKHPPPWC